jgi:hypothetical protein
MDGVGTTVARTAAGEKDSLKTPRDRALDVVADMEEKQYLLNNDVINWIKCQIEQALVEEREACAVIADRYSVWAGAEIRARSKG